MNAIAKSELTRRAMLKTLAGAATALGAAPSLFAADSAHRRRLGVCIYSYGLHWRAGRDRHPQARFRDALEFIEYCHRLGASGVQISLGSKEAGYAAQVRAKAESLQMYFEAQTGLPRDEADVGRFDTDLALAREAGATVVRVACLSGRRYETFNSPEAFRDFFQRSWRSLTLAAPVAKKRSIRLAVENHKDWRIPEMLDWLKKLSSEHVGVCVDTGNNLALLEDPLEVADAFAPFAFSSHLKDMGVQEYEDGFLLSEVPLGQGFLDLKSIVATLRKANPAIQFNLEMITRDPLKIPCLGEKYWATMQDTPASRLAATLSMVRRVKSKTELPRTSGLDVAAQLALEDENVRKSFAHAPTLDP
jgi:sugar phosphate isomerase/epimerase